MLASANKLKAVGADFLVCPDNTIHQALPHVVRRSPLRWLHIAEEVAGVALARGFKLLAITGTRWLVDSKVYPDALTAQGLAYMRPTPEERDEINRIIMDELVCSVFKAEAVAYIQRVFARIKDAGCDAVVLGCTEIPLIMNDANSPLPTLDSTRLLARAALRQAVAASPRIFAFPAHARLSLVGRRPHLFRIWPSWGRERRSAPPCRMTRLRGLRRQWIRLV